MQVCDDAGRVVADGSAFVIARSLLLQCTADQRAELARVLADMAAPARPKKPPLRPLEVLLRERERKGLPVLKLFE